MERIKEAIKLAKSRQEAGQVAAPRVPVGHLPPAADTPAPAARRAAADLSPILNLNPSHLEASRIVGHLVDSPLTVPYDILRTKVVQEMDQNGWSILVITSPTAGCGKTVTATNLALSIAKLPGRHVVLVDLDLRKASIAATLGISLARDLSDYIRGEASLSDIKVHVNIAGPQLTIIGNKSVIPNSSEVIGSQRVISLFEELRRLPDKPVIIVDMPPVLVSDDVIAFVPQSDCCLLTVQESVTTVSEIESSEDLLRSTNFLGCVLNKSVDRQKTYYY